MFKPLKIDDVSQLRDSVAENAEAVEPGLKALDARVLFGGATIDLLAMDAEGSLVLLAAGLTADDEMLVRALDAYSWCLEYPDAVKRLYPMARLSETEPPRVLFVAEEMPDAFLRKVKHLRLPRIACLEFRFGLQCTLVAGPRGGEERPAAVEPAVEATVEPAPADEAKGELLDGLHLPDNGNLSTQWRRVLTTAPSGPAVASEPDEGRVAAVREYLQREFPAAVIYDFYDHDRAARVYHLQDSQGSVVHTAAVLADVLSEHSEREMVGHFERHKLARVLRQAGQVPVAVTKAGLKIERR
ncbi:MAG: hypothetical protein HY728_08500 [Candidatus Rokubacteria bacterium]|nr:hypothetical protein [Candidatus Rokubacteria bacterium]